MKSMIKLYLVIRTAVLFMARPLFYVIFFPLLLAAAILPGKENIIRLAATQFMQWMSDFANLIMFGHGYETPDLLIMLCAVLPTVIAASWVVLERIFGIHYLLRSNGLIR